MTRTQGLADGVVVINLDDRTDRWEAFQQRVAPQLGLETVERLPALRGTELPGFGEPPFFRGRKRDRTWAGRAGCTLSHRAALSHALQAGWQRVLILEDDIELTKDFSGLRELLAKALEKVEWDVCYLGFTDPIGPVRKVTDVDSGHALYEIVGCNCAHAYLVNRKACLEILDQLPETTTIWHWLTRHRAIDRWYMRTLSRRMVVMALSPSVINQSGGVSDITGRTYENKHLTEIASSSSDAAAFRLGRIWRFALFGVEGIYDSLRGAIKRLRGF